MTVLRHTISFQCSVPDGTVLDLDDALVMDIENSVRTAAEEGIKGENNGAFCHFIHNRAQAVCEWEVVRKYGNGGNDAAMTLLILDKDGSTINTIWLHSTEDVRTFTSLIANRSVASADRNIERATDALRAIVAAGNHVVKGS